MNPITSPGLPYIHLIPSLLNLNPYLRYLEYLPGQ